MMFRCSDHYNVYPVCQLPMEVLEKKATLERFGEAEWPEPRNPGRKKMKPERGQNPVNSKKKKPKRKPTNVPKKKPKHKKKKKKKRVRNTTPKTPKKSKVQKQIEKVKKEIKEMNRKKSKNKNKNRNQMHRSDEENLN